MAIPLVYNVRSVRQRWTSSVVAVLGIAGTVGVFVAMLAMAQGFKATLVSSGSPRNAIVRRAGADSEMVSADESGSAPRDRGRARCGAEGQPPLVSGEVVVIAGFDLKSTGTVANAQVRGVSGKAIEIRDNVRVAQGRFFTPEWRSWSSGGTP